MDKYLIEKKEGSPRLFRIKNIVEFIELTTWISLDGHVAFRGQRRDLPLIPSIGRDKDSKRWFFAEEDVFEEFKREAVPYLGFLPQNNWQWLSVAQHNRLPTRMLDWTKNPLAALWFVVRNPADGKNPGVVWAYNYEPKDAISSTIDLNFSLSSPFKIDKTYLYFPEHVFSSIQAQSGIFTIHHRQTEDNEFVPFENTKDADLFLSKIEVTANSFQNIRYHLFRLGITHSSLFPGISGLVERIKYEYEPCEDEITLGGIKKALLKSS